MMETPPEMDLNPPDVSVTTRARSSGALEIAGLTLLGAASICGLMLTVLFLIPTEDPAQYSLVLSGLGLMVAGLTSIAMLWFRDRRHPISGMLAVGVLSWFIGAIILCVGGTFLFLPSETQIGENLGYATFFCFVPGGLLALLGLIFYGYEYRRRRRPAQAENLSVGFVDMSRPDKVQRAEEYLSHIVDLLKHKRLPLPTYQADDLTTRLTQWRDRVKQLVSRLERYEANPVIQRDLQTVPKTIERLKRELAEETDPQLSQQLAETLRSCEMQLDQLTALQRLMRRTDLEIDETLATIGTIYSQLHLLDAKEIDSERAARLTSNIEEESTRLGDLLTALDEVYSEVGHSGASA
jgi:hypothetical protein